MLILEKPSVLSKTQIELVLKISIYKTNSILVFDDLIGKGKTITLFHLSK